MRSKYPVKQRRTKEKNSRTVSMIILTIAIEIFAVLFVFLSFQESTANIFHAGNDNFFPLMLEIMSVMLAIVALFTSYFSIMKKRWQEDGEEELESYSRRLKQAVIPRDTKEEQQNSAGKKEVDALGRMMINLEDIKEFYTWSQKQAKAAFVLAVSMCILGFGLIIIASRTGNADKRRRNTAFAIPISRNRYGNYPVVSFLIHRVCKLNT